METLKQKLKLLKNRLEKTVNALDLQAKKRRLLELEVKANKASFWDDPQKAQEVMQEIDEIKEIFKTSELLDKEITEALSVVGEQELQGEVEETINKVAKEIGKLELKTFLSGRYDRNDAILSLHSGQGGTEAMDWAQMLFRMYLKFTERQGWKADVVSETPGEEAGIKSVTLFISGKYAYGYLKGEAGTHRLVRQSPFNADKLRQTSFALVEVLPRLEEKEGLEINDDDLEWQFFRASSQGGQNVQKVSTAVRLTHKPTGIVVTAQSERYQEQNRKIAFLLLQAKLWEKRTKEEQEKMKKLKGKYHPASWGTQIRSYVLHPYKMVRDLRTGHKTSDTEGVLDGDLEGFVESQLTWLGGWKQ